MIKQLLTRKALIAAAALTVGGAAVTVPVLASNTPGPTAQSAAASTDSKHDGHRGGKHGLLHRLRGLAVKTTAKDTGLPMDTVRNQLHADKSLNDIAGDKAGQVETDVLAQIKAHLDKAVAKGAMTAEKESEVLAKAKTALDKLMADHHTGGHGGQHGGHDSQKPNK